MANIYNKKRLRCWLNSINTANGFRKENRRTHIYSRHIDISDMQMKDRLRHIPFQRDEIIASSRFHDECAAIMATCACLRLHENELLEYLASDRQEMFHMSRDFKYTIGESFVKETNWEQMFPMSRVIVVVAKTEDKQNPLKIITAYPIFTMDEVDGVWDAIDDWLKKREKKQW